MKCVPGPVELLKIAIFAILHNDNNQQGVVIYKMEKNTYYQVLHHPHSLHDIIAYAYNYTHCQCSVSDHTLKPGLSNCARGIPHH